MLFRSLANNGATVLGPVGAASVHLGELLALYRQGQHAPLPFYPKTAWAWLEGKSGWRSAWSGGKHPPRPGECDDVYLRLGLRDRADDPLGPLFQQMARLIFGPLQKLMREAGHGDS